MSQLRSSGLAPGLLIGDRVQVGNGVRLGGHVVLHDDTVVGDRCEIQDGAIIGKRPQLGARSTATVLSGGVRLDDGARVCCGAVIAAGARIGAGAVIGDQAFIREGALIGPESVIGQGCAIGRGVRTGARSRLQNRVIVAPGSLLEEDVFIGPAVTMINDSTMGRHGRESLATGVKARRACRIGAAAVLMPGIEIGPEAVVAAGSLVTRDVPARMVVVGSPARPARRIEDDELLEHWTISDRGWRSPPRSSMTSSHRHRGIRVFH
jgi:acetyltransferase-like isoleucine patch superfamily enzyme